MARIYQDNGSDILRSGDCRQCGRVNFDPDDILHLVVETQCGVDFEKVKEDISLVAPEYADRVISFEEWQEKYANNYKSEKKSES